MRLKLALFDFCPYCQRVRILLEHYKMPYELEWIGQNAKPAWFSAASPLGRVPVLAVNEVPIIESAVIGELVDELGGARMLPTDPVARAQIRVTVARASESQSSFGAMIRAEDQAAFAAALDQLHHNLAPIEKAFDATGAYFGGADLCMVDVVLAPLLTRMRLLQPLLPCFPEDLPRLERLADTLTCLPEVHRSVDGDPVRAFDSMIEHLNPSGYVARHWPGTRDLCLERSEP
ncbi:glutathione S-transferase family protein [Lamprobacter modestohalophilus]|uniref:glutathione S-transferase family protein n=1 Tax=Lamprobacter modestohalophilus TaxID=1064514 RepID=UPI002ADEF862|nr:glutathione S-transferase family protein [Lamprobacter modestohalophilus]MEA1051731.1 glutathione S-transferase family protein [Lamprobacter modestohalophilus]